MQAVVDLEWIVPKVKRVCREVGISAQIWAFRCVGIDFEDLDKPRVMPTVAAEVCGETSEETPRSTEPPISERDLQMRLVLYKCMFFVQKYVFYQKKIKH